jgi:hypothetical protein
MAKEFGTGRNFTFLRINSKGELYESSKDPKEGFNEIVLDPGTPNERKTYQKSYKSTDYGKVSYLAITEKNFPKGKVNYVELSVQSDEDPTGVDVIQLPLRSLKGGLNDEVKKLIAILPSLDYSKSIIISSNREKNLRGYVDKILYFRYKQEEGQDKDTPIKFSLKFGEKGNVPMFLIEEDPINPSQKTMNYKDQDKFLSQVLMYELKRYEDFKAGNVYQSEFYKEWEPTEADTTTPQATTAQPAASQTPVTATTTGENPFAANAVEEDGDLPF